MQINLQMLIADFLGGTRRVAANFGPYTLRKVHYLRFLLQQNIWWKNTFINNVNSNKSFCAESELQFVTACQNRRANEVDIKYLWFPWRTWSTSIWLVVLTLTYVDNKSFRALAYPESITSFIIRRVTGIYMLCNDLLTTYVSALSRAERYEFRCSTTIIDIYVMFSRVIRKKLKIYLLEK